MKDAPHTRLNLSLFALCIVLGAQTEFALAQAENPQAVLQAGHADAIFALAISPNSSMLASGGLDGTIKIWNISEGRLWRTLEGPFAVIDALAFSPDSRLLASGADDHVTLFDVATGSQVRRIKACDPVLKNRQVLSDFSVSNPSAVAAVAFGPAGRLLVSACDGDESIKVWDLATDQPPRQMQLPSDPTESTRQELFGMTVAKRSAGVTALAFDSTGRWLASGSNDNAVRVWEFSTARQVLVLRGHATTAISLSFSADGRFLASSDPEISRLWDVASGASVSVASGGWSAFDSQGRWLLAQEDGHVTARDIAARKNEQIPGKLQRDRPMVLSPTRRWLISAGKTLVVTDLIAGDERRLLDFTVARRRLTPSRDGNWLALQPYFSNDTQTRLKLWNVETGQFQTLSGPGASHATFSADGRLLAASADDKVIRLWDVASAREMKSFTFANSIGSVSLTSSGRWLAAAGYDGTIRVWEVDSGQLIRSLSVDGSTTVAFSPDSRWLVYSTPDGIILTDAQTGERVRTIKGFAPILFSPDSRMLALSDGPGVIKIWDVLTGQDVRTLKRGFADMWSTAFSADNRWLASRDRDQNVVLWDLQTGESAGVFVGYNVGFAAGGKFLWITGKDGITRFWSSEKGTLIASLVLMDDSDDWAIVTPDGRFDGTTLGIQKLVAFRSDNRILPSDQFMRLRTPGLLADMLLD